MSEGVDYSYARPGGAALKAAGKDFAVRYLWSPSSGGLSNDEIADLHSNGVAIALVMEQGTTDALGGISKGEAHANLAVQRLAALNLDQNLPIYFAVDTDTSWNSVSEYFHGAANVLGAGRVGIYAGIRPIQGAQGSPWVKWFWQTYAWSGGNVAGGIHLLQYSNGHTINGGSVDYCRSYTDNFGQSAGNAGGSTSSPTSAPTGVPMKGKQNNMKLINVRDWGGPGVPAKILIEDGKPDKVVPNDAVANVIGVIYTDQDINHLPDFSRGEYNDVANLRGSGA